MVTRTTESAPRSVWESLSGRQRRFVSGALIIGFAQLILVDVFFRLQELSQIQQFLAGGTPSNLIEDGIQYPPFVWSGLACGTLVAASVILVNSKAKAGPAGKLTWLGSAWLIASALLVLDLAIDTFELKWPIIILFAYGGLRYWKGVRHNWLSLILAPVVALIAAGDGLNHFSGQDCVPTGIDACPGKAVSDIYLVIMLLMLLYATVKVSSDPTGDDESRRLRGHGLGAPTFSYAPKSASHGRKGLGEKALFTRTNHRATERRVAER